MGDECEMAPPYAAAATSRQPICGRRTSKMRAVASPATNAEGGGWMLCETGVFTMLGQSLAPTACTGAEGRGIEETAILYSLRGATCYTSQKIAPASGDPQSLRPYSCIAPSLLGWVYKT